MNQKKHDFVIYTDEQLDICNADQPKTNESHDKWTMWLDKSRFLSLESSKTVLKPVKSDFDFEQMFYLRREVEHAFKISDPTIIKSYINGIRKMTNRYQGRWYLARLDDIIIGEIGMIPFDFEGKKIGRLKDIDIIPQFQKNGFGKELLTLICMIAKEENLDGLCLATNSDDWKIDWFLKLGFENVGVYTY